MVLSHIASDMSLDMVQRARRGCYGQMEVNRGLPAKLLVKHFTKQPDGWQLQENIRRLVEFRTINLVDAWLDLPMVDVVFLRNVLIYFDPGTKRAILRKVRQLLRPGGYLFLGGAESTLNIDDGFERVAYDRGCCFPLARDVGCPVR